MNLFLVGRGRASAQEAREALAGLLERLPFMPGAEPAVWSGGGAVAACAAHPPEQIGAVAYHAFEPDRFALFAGRPIRWRDATVADGRGPLDARAYLPGVPDGLDGRYAVVRGGAGGGVEFATDPLGAYPLYARSLDGTEWVSNSAELLRSLDGSRKLSAAVLASVLGGGWSLAGDPAWAAVRRVARGGPHRLGEDVRGGAGFDPSAIGAGFDAARAAAVLSASVAALADWPGRPSVVPVTGGRDSRLVLAAAMCAGIELSTTTGGEPGAADVELGRALARRAGVAHALIAPDPGGGLPGDWRRAAALLDLTASGTATLADAPGFPFGPRPGPLPLWHSGQGGEIARSYYGPGPADASPTELVERLYRAFVARRPGRAELLSPAGAEAVRSQLGAFVEEQLAAGARAVDVPDLFYLWRRMGTWAGPTHGAVEPVRDTTSPLWSHRLLADELGLPAPERAQELFHLRVLRALAPDLLAVPYEDGRLPGDPPRRRGLARKALAELRRRARAARAGPDAFAPVLSEIAELVLSTPAHAAWAVLDRGRVTALLRSDARSLDAMSRYYVWRLATVFTLGAGD